MLPKVVECLLGLAGRVERRTRTRTTIPKKRRKNSQSPNHGAIVVNETVNPIPILAITILLLLRPTRARNPSWSPLRRLRCLNLNLNLTTITTTTPRTTTNTNSLTLNTLLLRSTPLRCPLTPILQLLLHPPILYNTSSNSNNSNNNNNNNLNALPLREPAARTTIPSVRPWILPLLLLLLLLPPPRPVLPLALRFAPVPRPPLPVSSILRRLRPPIMSTRPCPGPPPAIFPPRSLHQPRILERRLLRITP